MLARRLIPNTRNPGESPLDPIGATLSVLGLVGVLLGIIQAPNSGWTSPLVLGGFIGGGLFLGVFACGSGAPPRR